MSGLFDREALEAAKAMAGKRGEAAFNSGGTLGENPFSIGAYAEWKAWRQGFKRARQAHRDRLAAKPASGG